MSTKTLTQVIEKSGKSKAEIARALGVTRQAINSYENNTPKPDTLMRVLLACGWTEDSLKDERLIDWYTP